MATLWRKPAMPLWIGPGTAVTAAALTSGLANASNNELPALDPIDIPGSKLTVEAHMEITSTSATPTVTFGLYFGTVGSAIGSKTLVIASAALAISASATGWEAHFRYVGTFNKLSSSVGVLHGGGHTESMFNVGLTGAPVWARLGSTQAGRTVSTWNTKQYNELDLGVTLSSVTGTPSVTVTDFWAELVG